MGEQDKPKAIPEAGEIIKDARYFDHPLSAEEVKERFEAETKTEMHICHECGHCKQMRSQESSWFFRSHCILAKRIRIGRVTGMEHYELCYDIRRKMDTDDCVDYVYRKPLPPRDWRWLWLRRKKEGETNDR